MSHPRAQKVQLVLPPPKRPDTYAPKYARWPQPLGILSIGAYLRQNNPDVEVEILDGNNVLTLGEVKSRLDAHVVGVSTTAVGYVHALEVAEVAKRRGARVVLGGAGATPMAREILTYHSYVDAVVRYDGEIAFSRYVAGDPLDSIENLVWRDGGAVRENPVALPDLDELPPPDRSLVDVETYFRNSKDPDYPLCEPFHRPMSLYSQKGCVWRAQEEGGCLFCAIPYYDLRLRTPRLVWDDIRSLVETYQADFFWDPSDNLVGDREWFQSFCAERPGDLAIHYTNYVDAKGIDDEVARLLAESGCVSVFVGMEAGDPLMLKNMNKRSTLEDNLRAMEILGKHRIGVVAGVVVGVPGESRQSLMRTLDFLKRLTEYDNFDRLEWGSLIPFPGSKANRMLREHPRLRNKYKHFGDENYQADFMSMVEDWYACFCEVSFDDVMRIQEEVARAGLVPYEMTKYQRRSWSGTPSKVFL